MIGYCKLQLNPSCATHFLPLHEMLLKHLIYIYDYTGDAYREGTWDAGAAACEELKLIYVFVFMKIHGKLITRLFKKTLNGKSVH